MVAHVLHRELYVGLDSQTASYDSLKIITAYFMIQLIQPADVRAMTSSCRTPSESKLIHCLLDIIALHHYQTNSQIDVQLGDQEKSSCGEWHQSNLQEKLSLQAVVQRFIIHTTNIICEKDRHSRCRWKQRRYQLCHLNTQTNYFVCIKSWQTKLFSYFLSMLFYISIFFLQYTESQVTKSNIFCLSNPFSLPEHEENPAVDRDGLQAVSGAQQEVPQRLPPDRGGDAPDLQPGAEPPLQPAAEVQQKRVREAKREKEGTQEEFQIRKRTLLVHHI
ncbi:Hypothetical_protein [Hexamita inflata]|uniref:Hypothetical_protein n=1 Tax=Hexamita inflata TaxID=28002 RepID=A0AA86QNF0_9EUKA|nr:Hypothetical protein HINF_LOCUS44827 [Hexamita inflata]